MNIIIVILARSPIYSHLNASLRGLTTVRAFGAEAALKQEFHQQQDCQTSASFLFTYATRGFAMWLDLICIAYIVSVVFGLLIFAFGKPCCPHIKILIDSHE